MIIKCPYCKGHNIMALPEVVESIMPRALHHKLNDFQNKLVKLEPMYCHDCHVGFNKSNLDDETLLHCFQEYEFIKPSLGIGATHYHDFINFIKEHSTKDDFIIDIGCYDGFILKSLQKDGYTKLLGYDPATPVDNTDSVLIKREFFTKESKLQERADGFILCNILEVIDDIQGFLVTLHKNLNTQGKIYIEVPTIFGVSSVQKWRFSEDFFDKLAKDTGFRVIAINNSLLDSSAFDGFRVILEKIESIDEYKAFYDDNTIQKIYQKTLSIYKDKLLSKDFILSMTDLIKENNQEGVPTVIWGGGKATFNILASLDPMLVERSEFLILDSDTSREGALFLSPINTEIKTRCAFCFFDEIDYLDNIVIGVFSKDFIEEIKESLVKIQKDKHMYIKKILTKDGFIYID